MKRQHGYPNLSPSGGETGGLRHGGEVRRVLVVVNPNSGHRRGVAAVDEFVKRLGGVKVTIRHTKHAGHCQEICQTESFEGVDCLAVVGGDGTLFEAINGLMLRVAQQPLLLAIVPAGTGNSVAYDLGIRSVQHAAELVLLAQYRAIDLAKVESPDCGDKYAINMCGWAMASQVLQDANRYRRFGLGAWYNFASYKYLLANQSHSAKLTLTLADDSEVVLQERWGVVCVQNTVHIGTRMPLAPTAQLDDGLLDLTVLTSRGRLTNIRTLMLAGKGQHTARKQLAQYKVKRVVLENLDQQLAGKGTVNLDGELCSASPFTVSVIPGAVRILCPE